MRPCFLNPSSQTQIHRCTLHYIPSLPHSSQRSIADRQPSSPALHSYTKFMPGVPIDDISEDEVLQCPQIRDRLTPMDSPFKEHNNFGGGFVHDDDRVALSALRFASSSSAGSGGCVIDYEEELNGDPNASEEYLIHTPTGNGNNGSSGAVTSKSNALQKQQQTTTNGTAAFKSKTISDRLCVPLPPWAMRAGPRETIYFNPAETRVAIVTCGGLCPGLNDVVQGLVGKSEDYGVPEGNILGIRYGFKGFYDRTQKPITLTKRSVEGIHLEGGTILGTSRGGADLKKIVKQIDLWGIDLLFVVGGNGGNAGAASIQAELDKASIVCSVVGVPKSIDNDILLIDRCFGFDTAVEEAQRALISAKVEASSAYRGVGLVKLMGRSSGFIAMNTSLSSGVVDVCLIPEVPFSLKGEKGLFKYLEKVLAERGHAVICIAEGAGQDLISDRPKNTDETEAETDASGNPILKDVGTWLRSQIKKNVHDVDLKYIDPSYLIRSIPTTSTDRIYCKVLAHNAVHAAFSGFTGVVVGLVNTHYVLLPIPVVIQQARRVDPNGKQWNRLRASIGQNF